MFSYGVFVMERPWHDVCLSSTIVYESRVGRVEVCNEVSSDIYDDAVLVYTDSPFLAQSILEFLHRYHAAITHLVSLIVDDLWMLRGSHAEKNRAITRIAKLLGLLYSLGVEFRMDNILYAILPAFTLYGAWRIARHLPALMTFKGHERRIRDMVHELIYPHLRRDLERIMNVIVYADVTRGPQLVCMITTIARHDGIEMHTDCHLPVTIEYDGGTRMFDIDVDYKRFLAKIIERRRRRQRKRYTDDYVEIPEALLVDARLSR